MLGEALQGLQTLGLMTGAGAFAEPECAPYSFGVMAIYALHQSI